MHGEEIQTPHEPHTGEIEIPSHNASMEDWLGEHDHRTSRRDDIVRGQIVHSSEDSLMVDIGTKTVLDIAVESATK